MSYPALEPTVGDTLVSMTAESLARCGLDPRRTYCYTHPRWRRRRGLPSQAASADRSQVELVRGKSAIKSISARCRGVCVRESSPSTSWITSAGSVAIEDGDPSSPAGHRRSTRPLVRKLEAANKPRCGGPRLPDSESASQEKAAKSDNRPAVASSGSSKPSSAAAVSILDAPTRRSLGTPTVPSRVYTAPEARAAARSVGARNAPMIHRIGMTNPIQNIQ